MTVEMSGAGVMSTLKRWTYMRLMNIQVYFITCPPRGIHLPLRLQVLVPAFEVVFSQKKKEPISKKSSTNVTGSARRQASTVEITLHTIEER